MLYLARVGSRHCSSFAPSQRLTLHGAQKAVSAATAEAQSNGWAVSIAVVDAGGHPLCLHRLDAAAPSSAGIASEKARTAAMFRKPTAVFEAAVNIDADVIAMSQIARTALLSAPYVLMQGGVPIVLDGECVGAVGVSGVQSPQDEQVALAGVAALGGHD